MCVCVSEELRAEITAPINYNWSRPCANSPVVLSGKILQGQARAGKGGGGITTVPMAGGGRFREELHLILILLALFQVFK